MSSVPMEPMENEIFAIKESVEQGDGKQRV